MQAYQDVKDVSRAWQDESVYDQDNSAGRIKRLREEDEEDGDGDDGDYDKNEGSRSRYKCGLCGQPKKGHSCSAHKAAAEQFWGSRAYPPAAAPFAGASAPSVNVSNKRMVLVSKLRERLERRLFGQPDNGSAQARFAQPGFSMQGAGGGQGGGGVEQMYGAPAQNHVQDVGYYQQWAQYAGHQQGAAAQPQAPQPGSAALYPWFAMQGQVPQQPGSGPGAFTALGGYPPAQYPGDPAQFNQEPLSDSPPPTTGKGRGRGRGRGRKA